MTAKRANGQGSVRVRKRRDGQPSYMAQAMVLDAVGRRSRLTRSFPSRGAAEAWLEDRARESTAGEPHRAPTQATLREFGRLWTGVILVNQVAVGKIRPKTYDTYVWAWGHIDAELGHLRLSAITPHQIEAWEASKLASKNSRGVPFSAASVRSMHRALRRCLNDAKRARYIENNPMDGLELPKGSRRQVEPLTATEVGALLSYASDQPRFGALWWVLLGLGLRVGEALALRWSDFSPDRSTVTISRTVSRHYVRAGAGSGRRTAVVEGPTKTEGSRAVLQIPDSLAERISRHELEQGQDRLTATRWDDADLVFATPVGTHMDLSAVARELRAACASAGIDRRVHPHLLRHTTASLLVSHVQMRVITELLRHERESTTSQIYAHLLPEARKAGAVALDGILVQAVESFRGLMRASASPRRPAGVRL